MKKLFALVLAIVFTMSFVGCNEQNPSDGVSSATSENSSKSSLTVTPFSYAEDRSIYKNGEPGVKHEGFVNTSELSSFTVKDVVDRAKKECNIEYDSTNVYFDSELNIWMVDFSTEGFDGGNQSVYINENGKTVLIVYGE